MGSDFRRAFGAEDRLDRLANHFLSGLPIKTESSRIDLRVTETPVAVLHDDGVAFRGMIEECLDERFRSGKLPSAILNPPLQGLVELSQRALRLLRSGNIVGDADEADVLAAGPPSGLRFRSQPTPLAVVTPIASLKRERFQRALAGSLLAKDSRKIVGMKRFAPIEIQGRRIGNAQELVIGAVDELSQTVEPAHPHRHGSAVRDRPKPLFALGQNPFGEFAGRYVHDDGVEAEGASRGILMRNMDDFGLDRSARSREIGLVR